MEIIAIILAVIVAVVAILYLVTKSKLGKVNSALVAKENLITHNPQPTLEAYLA